MSFQQFILAAIFVLHSVFPSVTSYIIPLQLEVKWITIQQSRKNDGGLFSAQQNNIHLTFKLLFLQGEFFKRVHSLLRRYNFSSHHVLD